MTAPAGGGAPRDLLPGYAGNVAREEDVYNSLLRATTVTGNGHTAEAIPIDRLKEIFAKNAKR